MVNKLPPEAVALIVAERGIREDLIAMHLLNQELVLALIADLQSAGLTDAQRLAVALAPTLHAVATEGAGVPRLPALAEALLARLHYVAHQAPAAAVPPPRR